MWMKPDCLACLYNQMLRTSKAMHCDDGCATRIMEETAAAIARLPMEQTPPEAAAILYPIAADIAGTDDPYRELKKQAVARARALIPEVAAMVKRSEDPLDAALRASVAGNVIDYATQVQFSLEEELEKIFHTPFAVDDKAIFLERLRDSQHLLVIGDNVGEHLFDKVMLETIHRFYPELKLYYMVRGRPIINDVTMEEAMEAGLQDLAILVDSCVDTPGFLVERASEAAREIYQSADLVLAKGMGNFECMESLADKRVMFLLKIKCSVVAEKVGENIGDLVAMMGRKGPF
jgi:uncharacterized protein with ATP-grasp and redox domains